ncbi:MAG: F0F1 ATP synthase subunit alpha [Dehalococcoidia bacterium]|nr:F0F1 ATP synthase subunit alpha [Dehalococcoidia bacterium]
MSSIKNDIISALKAQVEQFGSAVKVVDVGNVLTVGDGVATIEGLSAAKYNELLQFPGDVIGIALNLEEDSVSAVILGDDKGIKAGDEVRATGRVAEVPVGDSLIGRVVDPLGRPLDGKGTIKSSRTRPLEKMAPNVVMRRSVDTPVQTGIKCVDAMIPIGRGQRELIIGDRSTGKTALALDTIINQRGGDLICIYVAIGQKASKVAQVIGKLEEMGAMEHTIVVVANSADSVALQYLAPYAGCAIGEEFMEAGKDALVVYDDLSKHGWAYRQMSLLLHRPPGREAYPGDVFYLHSRLLERAARLDLEHGGGSLTALPIIETQAGDVSAYIPTNVISITDGQLYLETDLFNAGIRPALNAGTSVSRVGSAAQTKAMKKVAGKLKLAMAQYRELAAFAQFGTSELDKSTKAQIDRGRLVTEVLKQSQYTPMPLEQQVTILYAAINGLVDDIPAAKMDDFEKGLHQYLVTQHSEIGETIASTKTLDDDTEEKLKNAISDYKKMF